ncbi:ATP-binding protein [Steroidobacter denitrificans]|uniref:ATP-binding protein n=1 Tax=Steroidobacter denitrificans TaxID=465721 RepID=UPI00389AACDE
MSRSERFSTIITSSRPVGNWPKLLGDVVVMPLLDRLMRRLHLPKFESKSWCLKEVSARVAKGAQSA